MKTGLLKLADRGTKTINPFNKKEKIFISIRATSVNDKGGEVGEEGHTGPDNMVSNQSII